GRHRHHAPVLAQLAPPPLGPPDGDDAGWAAMRIYIAARYDRRWEMLGVASTLSRAGHEVTSRWIEGGRGDDPAVVPAVEDLIDLTRADSLVSSTEEPTQGVRWAARGGRHVEFGVALATGKRLCIVGPRE